MALKSAVTGLPVLFLRSPRGTPRTAPCFKERHRQVSTMTSITQPRWEQHPELPSPPLAPWLLLPLPTIAAVVLKGTDLPAAATLLRPCYCCIYVFMINSPEQLINPQCQGYRQRRGHVSKAACICSPAARSPGPLERILGNVAKGLWESCGNLPPYYPAFNLALVGRK